MPRPNSKSELLQLSEVNFLKLLDFIDQLSIKEQEKLFPKGTLNRNISDVLMHLHHWHLMLLNWYDVGMKGEKPEMPAKGYTWKTTPELNKWIQKQYCDIPLDKAKTNLKKSYEEVRAIIEQHTNEELFEKKRYKWTGSTSLGSYIISATSSHYDWAFKLIKKAKT
ncbi:ClbS/DfsB family four-helix bundle protein [Winogradskyella luteola]|uniref:ClbS/DfsB family four-helix bundle protein n=1 Tax=Winogradskyella luteola TaxID=2828330 RepID=A0A9X1F7N7_9FLAO|nr:ClbS/DfsB family four-helix bundle protein [Winogradskyella luteola]MBV7268641.1 ClbS/DfsB family four-helix bundle protein [Winogradskyella luteola]